MDFGYKLGTVSGGPKEFHLLFVLPVPGINARHASKWNERSTEELVKLYKHPAYKSVGLIGLDFTDEGLRRSNKSQQFEVLEAQVIFW